MKVGWNAINSSPAPVFLCCCYRPHAQHTGPASLRTPAAPEPSWSPCWPQSALWHWGSPGHSAGPAPQEPDLIHPHGAGAAAQGVSPSGRVSAWQGEALQKDLTTPYSPVCPKLLQTDGALLNTVTCPTEGFSGHHLPALSLQRPAQPPRHPSPFHPLVFLWPPQDLEEMNQYLSCKLESTYDTWAMNVQCSYNDLKRQLAVHNAYAGSYSFLCGVKWECFVVCWNLRCVPVSHSGFLEGSYSSSPVNTAKVKHCWVYWGYLLSLFMISLDNFSVYQTATLIDRRTFPLKNFKQIS